jgi:uncharacterized protein (TIGR03437 family)
MKPKSNRSFSRSASGLLLAAVALAPTLAAQSDAALFDTSIVQEIRLTSDPDNWQQLRDNFDKDDFYRADFLWNGAYLQDIGIRSAGAGGGSSLKPNLALQFNKYDSRARLLGRTSLLLKANNRDASMLREFISLGLMARLGLPVSREAFARVFVNEEYFGLYTIAEEIDESFLAKVQGQPSGFLYQFRPRLGYQFEYLGDNEAEYAALFEAKTHRSEPQYWRLVDLIRAVNETGDAFSVTIPYSLDLNGLVKLLAVENYVADSDGILSDSQGMNNYYLLRSLGGAQFAFLPGDADSSLNGADRPITKGIETNILARNAYAVPALKQLYLETLQQAGIVAGGGDGWMHTEIQRLANLIGEDARLDPNKQCVRSAGIEQCTAEDFDREVAKILQFAADRFTVTTPQLEALIGAPQPRMPDTSVVNAATNQPGIVPGSLATIYGASMAREGGTADSWPLPLTLADASVTVNGVAAPLLFVSPQQINFQVPWNLQEGTATVVVSTAGGSSIPVQTELQHTAPGILAAAHTSTYAAVSAANPVVGGEIIGLFSTGLGPVDPEVQDGVQAPGDPLALTKERVTATVNGEPAIVWFAGLAPGLAGLYQVNVQMPQTLTSNNGTISVVISADGKSSPAFQMAH